MSSTTGAAAPSKQSSFITGIAWSFIALTGISLVLAAMQYTLFAYFVPMDALREAVAEAIHLKVLPAAAMKIVEHLRTIIVVILVASLITLLVSIGLLKRYDWARITFAWIMILTAIAHVAGLALPIYFMQGLTLDTDAMPPELRDAALKTIKFVMGMTIVPGIIFAGLFAWVAKRMCDADIKREFGATP